MAFGIGINNENQDAGMIRGSQQDIACECWFTQKGKIIPLMIKVQDEDGEIRCIKQIEVHSQEAKMYAGIPSVELDCTIVIMKQKIPVKLLYFQTENRWALNYR